MNPSQVYDPDLHPAGSPAADGRCSFHAGSPQEGSCEGSAVVSYRDDDGTWQSGCASALEELVAAGEIAPLGQGA